MQNHTRDLIWCRVSKTEQEMASRSSERSGHVDCLLFGI